MLLPMLEAVVEDRLAFFRGQCVPHPGRIRITRDRIVQERQELPAAIVFQHPVGVFLAVVAGQIRPSALDHVSGDLDAELGGLGEAVHDVEGHVRRRRAAGEPRESAQRGLGLPELRERGLLLRPRNARVQNIDEAGVLSFATPRLHQPGSLLEGNFAIRIRCVPGLEPGVPFRELLGHSGHGGVVPVEAGEDSRGNKTVQRLLRALVRVVDEIGEG